MQPKMVRCCAFLFWCQASVKWFIAHSNSGRPFVLYI